MSIDKDFCRTQYEEAVEAMENLQDMMETHLQPDDKLKAVDLCNIVSEALDNLSEAVEMS